MTTGRCTGVLIHGATKPAAVGELCELIEKNGFDEVWVGEDYFMLGGMTGAALALQRTQKLAVGIGIVSAVVRHPAVLAMEIATLAGAFPERLQVGIGHGVPAWTRQMGLYPRSPLQVLEQTLTSVRRLLAGEMLTEQQHFHFDAIKLEHPPVNNVPLYTGVLGPKSLALSYKIADGTIMSMLAGTKYLQWVRATISALTPQNHLHRNYKLPTFVIYSIDKDRKKAKAAARLIVAFYLKAAGPTPLTEVYGINDDITALIMEDDVEKIAQRIPDEWIDWLTVSGDPDECVAGIKSLHQAGATSVILAPVPAETIHQQLILTAAEVLPDLT